MSIFTYRVLFLLFTFGSTTRTVHCNSIAAQSNQQTKTSSLISRNHRSFIARRNANNNSIPILNESQKDILMEGANDYADLIQRRNGTATFGGGFNLMSVEDMFEEDTLNPGYDTALTLLKKTMIGKL